jgi:hypothetical protein
MKTSSNIKLDSLSEASKSYLSENVDAFSLCRRDFPYSGSGRSIQLGTLRGLCKHIANDLISGSVEYLKAMILGWREISKLSSIKGTKSDVRAIIIGNGPSQDFIKPEALQKFKKNGNDIHVINYWNENARLSSISPSHFITSDPYTLSETDYKSPDPDISKSNANLKAYLLNDPKITIAAPIWQTKYLKNVFGDNRVIGFVDGEMRALSSNTDPRFPRGYVSMTLFKALALAIHLGYKEIYLIGMDNTYPRDIYCDSNNHIFRRERHAGSPDYLVDFTPLLPSMAVQMQDIFNLFYDLQKCFVGSNVLNLDCYSLTDAFPKVSSLDEIDKLLNE